MRLACPPHWAPTPFQLTQGANKSSLPFIWALQAAGGRLRGGFGGWGGASGCRLRVFFFFFKAAGAASADSHEICIKAAPQTGHN